MNILDLKKEPHLSFSGISDYIDCGLLYKFSRIDKIKPESTSDALELGSCVHKSLAEFYQERMIGNEPSLKELQQVFETHWKTVERRSDIEYEDGYNWEIWLEKGKSLFATYYDKLPDDDFRVLAIEEPFSFVIKNLPIPIIGAVDLIEEDKSDSTYFPLIRFTNFV